MFTDGLRLKFKMHAREEVVVCLADKLKIGGGLSENKKNTQKSAEFGLKLKTVGRWVGWAGGRNESGGDSPIRIRQQVVGFRDFGHKKTKT